MEGLDRILFFYEMAKNQADHEQQISAELTSRSGLLAAIAGLICLALVEHARFVGNAWYLSLSGALLIFAVALIAMASLGKDYERPEGAKIWAEWANGETDADLAKALSEDYSECVEKGLAANDWKAARLNWAAILVSASFLILLVSVVCRSLFAA